MAVKFWFMLVFIFNLSLTFGKRRELLNKGSLGMESPYTVASSNADPTLLHPQSETASSDSDFRDVLFSREPNSVLLQGIASLSVNELLKF